MLTEKEKNKHKVFYVFNFYKNKNNKSLFVNFKRIKSLNFIINRLNKKEQLKEFFNNNDVIECHIRVKRKYHV